MEVLSQALTRLSNDKVKVSLIHAGVGAININDVLCQGLQGYFQGYLTPTEAAARMRGVQLIS